MHPVGCGGLGIGCSYWLVDLNMQQAARLRPSGIPEGGCLHLEKHVCCSVW